MTHSQKILNEKDPYLREIWAAGYTSVKDDQITCELVLISDNGNYKRIPYFHLTLHNLTIKRGLMPDGTIHSWLSEADGSAQKFRDLIT